MRRDILKCFNFMGEAQTIPTHIFSAKSPVCPLVVNSFPTDQLSLKQQLVSNLQFIGESRPIPIRNLRFRCLGMEWMVYDNLLYYSKPFSSLAFGDYHYNDETLKPLIFNSMITHASVSPSGETPRWGLYISTKSAVYFVSFESTKPAIKRLLFAGALGIGVVTLEKPIKEIPSGTQVVVVPTKQGIYLFTESGSMNLTSHHPRLLNAVDKVHIATKVDEYGQYFLFLFAPKK